MDAIALHFKRAFLPILFTLLLSVAGMKNATSQTNTLSSLNYSLNVDETSLNVISHVDDMPSHNADYGNGWSLSNNRSSEGVWYYYDNGQYQTAMGTGGGQFWWGVKFPAGSYSGNKITKVEAYDIMAMTGTVTIYNFGDNAPAIPVGQTDVTFTGAADFVEFEFAEPVFIDPNENLWVIFYNQSGATYPAAVCANTGDANGRYICLNGVDWVDVATLGFDYTFMVRAFIVSNGYGSDVNITTTADPSEGGTLSGEGTYQQGQTCTLTATANEGYTFMFWTEGDETVSAESVYSFTVARNRDLVAHFVPEENIVFADANVKSICISHWDTNGDGELSYAEAASVTDLSNYFQNNTEITSFDELQYFIGLSSIGVNAFKNCSGLTLVTLPPFLTSIGNYAFYNCSGLIGDLTIPNTVVTIGNYAYYNCSGYTGTLTIGNSVTSIGNAAFSGCTGLIGNIMIPDSVTSIGSSAFYNCTGITGSLTIPNSVTTIGENAFRGCSGFTGTLTIGNSVTSIGNSAFERCSNLVGNIDIPNSVTSIGSYAFNNCHGFTGYLTIPSSVTTIGGSAFTNCSGLSEVYYNVTNHDDINGGSYNYPFQSCGGHLVIGDDVVRIPSNMFRNANFTGTLTIPNSVIAINDNAFNNCRYFSGTLVIPNLVNTIGIGAFQDCDGLSEIILGNDVMIMGNKAFYSCSGLQKVTLPEPMTVIGDEVFKYCTQLNVVNMQSTQAPSIGQDVFANNAASRIINIPCYTTENYSNGYWSEWSDALNEMCDEYEIMVEVNPSVAGSVTGEGIYYYSEMCTLTAVGNLDYPFLNWTKNGVVVSTEATYSFGVTESCTYVANFEPHVYEITATANPTEGGTISGAGTYTEETACTLTATANVGYAFVNWTKDEVEVSTESTYSFTVTEDATYVANFIEQTISYEIIATANPTEGGTVSGAGTYEEGETCTLIATANEDYTFVNWTKDEVEVSTESTYSFTVTEDAAYVANFLEETVSYEIIATANPAEGGTVSGAGTYEEGETCTLIATANDGYIFVNWTKDEVEVSTESTYSFTVTEDAAYVANFIENQGGITQTSSFSQGYNWWSTYIEQEGINGLAMLQEGLGNNGVTIRSQASGYTDYYQGYGWYGSLSSINNESSYRVITSTPCTITMTGNAAVPSQHPITLSQGWTWIGYVPSTAMSIDAAFAGVEAAQGDKLKSQQGYADYYPGYGWFGSLNTIEPGMGLMYYSVNSSAITFIYPDGNRGGEVKANLTVEDNHWKPNTHAYPDNMTVMAVVELDDRELTSDNYELAIFAANGECRGSVKLTYAEPLNRHIAFLTVSGEDAAELNFMLYDMETGMEYYNAEESLDFVANAIVGDATDLYTIHFRGTTGMDELVRVYPNPVNAGEQFIVGLANDVTAPVRVEIINTLGVVETLRATSLQTITAPNVAGVYTLRITVDGERTSIHKLVVK